MSPCAAGTRDLNPETPATEYVRLGATCAYIGRTALQARCRTVGGYQVRDCIRPHIAEGIRNNNAQNVSEVVSYNSLVARSSWSPKWWSPSFYRRSRRRSTQSAPRSTAGA